MLSRVAEDLFWMARYVERGLTVARLSEVTWHLELDAGDDAGRLWIPLLAFGREPRGPNEPGGPSSSPREIRHYLAFDPENDHALITCVRRARGAAQGVRESISSEMWEQINRLHITLADPGLGEEAEQDATGFYRRVREGLQFFHGLADATLAHDEAWHFLNLGKFLERGDNIANLLELEAHLLATRGDTGRDDSVRWLAVLRSCGAAEAYARFYSLRVEPARVLEFALLNPVFPQSVRFSLTAARAALQEVAALRPIGDETSGPALRAMGRLCGRLEHVAVDEVLEEGLDVYVRDIRSRIDAVSAQIKRDYLRGDPHPDRLDVVARAAVIMAAQQQQQ